MKKNSEKKSNEKRKSNGKFLEYGVTLAGVLAFQGLAIAVASALGFPVDLLTDSGAEYYNETGGKHLF